jgi:predicted DNA-binding protein
MAGSQDSALFMRMSTDLKTRLTEIAKARGGRKLSTLIREVLEKFVEESSKVSA